MKIQKNYNNISFGYSSPLKTLYKKGKLPIKYGFYGDILTKKNVTLEHLKPHSQGGKTSLDNLVLATKENNQARGNKPINDFVYADYITRYLAQFKDIRINGFDGNRYIAGVVNTLKGLLNGG